jgi:hypothetical protein
MQGGGSDADKASVLRTYMRDGITAVICLQECGRLMDWTDQNLEPGWTIAIHRLWGGNIRCSLAILASGTVLNTHTFEATWAQGRPMIGANISGHWFWSVHAPANGNADYVRTALTAAAVWAGSGPWMCAGDFNLAPGTAAAPHNSVIVNSGRATRQSGREIDYAYLGGNWGARNWSASVGRNPRSDHWPVQISGPMRV